jgi:hypothetical protein
MKKSDIIPGLVYLVNASWLSHTRQLLAVQPILYVGQGDAISDISREPGLCIDVALSRISANKPAPRARQAGWLCKVAQVEADSPLNEVVSRLQARAGARCFFISKRFEYTLQEGLEYALDRRVERLAREATQGAWEPVKGALGAQEAVRRGFGVSADHANPADAHLYMRDVYNVEVAAAQQVVIRALANAMPDARATGRAERQSEWTAQDHYAALTDVADLGGLDDAEARPYRPTTARAVGAYAAAGFGVSNVRWHGDPKAIAEVLLSLPTFTLED